MLIFFVLKDLFFHKFDFNQKHLYSFLSSGRIDKKICFLDKGANYLTFAPSWSHMIFITSFVCIVMIDNGTLLKLCKSM